MSDIENIQDPFVSSFTIKDLYNHYDLLSETEQSIIKELNEIQFSADINSEDKQIEEDKLFADIGRIYMSKIEVESGKGLGIPFRIELENIFAQLHELDARIAKDREETVKLGQQTREKLDKLKDLINVGKDTSI